jgi:hypothetical protein
VGITCFGPLLGFRSGMIARPKTVAGQTTCKQDNKSMVFAKGTKAVQAFQVDTMLPL